MLSEKKLKSVVKVLPSGFEEAVRSAQSPELHTKIVNIEKLLAETQNAYEQDPELKQLKEELKLQAEDYKATIAEARAELRFLAHVLEERGEG